MGVSADPLPDHASTSKEVAINAIEEDTPPSLKRKSRESKKEASIVLRERGQGKDPDMEILISYMESYLSEQVITDEMAKEDNAITAEAETKDASFLDDGTYSAEPYREECPDCCIPHRLNHMRKFSSTYEFESAGSDEWLLAHFKERLAAHLVA